MQTMQSKPFKSCRHLALATENLAEARAESARSIARVLGAPPITRKHERPGTLVRVLRALWRWL